MNAAQRRPRVATRLLLVGGVVGPILFGSTILIAGATRPGYDPVRQFVSVLSLGDGGWIQAANFVAAGLLIIGFGIGLRRGAGAGQRRWTPRLMLLTGLALIVSGLFPADPQWGYPVWISAEAAANPSPHAVVHLIAGFVATCSFSLAMLIEAGRAARSGALARAGVTIMLGCFLIGLAVEPPGTGFPWAGVLQRVGLVAGLLWLGWFAADQLRGPKRMPAPEPCAPPPVRVGLGRRRTSSTGSPSVQRRLAGASSASPRPMGRRTNRLPSG